MASTKKVKEMPGPVGGGRRTRQGTAILQKPPQGGTAPRGVATAAAMMDGRTPQKDKVSMSLGDRSIRSESKNGLFGVGPVRVEAIFSAS